MLNDKQIHRIIGDHTSYTKSWILDFDKQWDDVVDKIRRSGAVLADIRLVPETDDIK